MRNKNVSMHSSNSSTYSTSTITSSSSNDSQSKSQTQPKFVIGAEVTTPYGNGRVADIRCEAGSTYHVEAVVVLLRSWRLTGKSFVTCYLQSKDVQMYVEKTVAEMNLQEKMQYAQKMRSKGKSTFGQKNYHTSLVANTKAVDTVRTILRTYSRKEIGKRNRANLLILKIDALLDAAACSIALEIYQGGEMFARRALQLIDTLDELHDESSPEAIQKKAKQSEQQICGNMRIFGEWRVRSYAIISSVMIHTRREKDAIQILNQAMDIITKYTTNDYYHCSNTTSPALVFQKSKLLAQKKKIETLLAQCLKTQYVIGAVVETPYGRGRVMHLGNLQMTVILTEWILANGATVTCHVGYDCVKLYVAKTVAQMKLNDQVNHAKAMKVQGGSAFLSKNYETSLDYNTKAVDAVRLIIRQGLEPGKLKSTLLTIKIDALNEAAACSNHLGIHDGAEMFARRALQLSDILEQTHRYSVLPKVSYGVGDDEVGEQMTEIKLFGEWRVRSHLLVAESLIMKKREYKAFAELDAASEVIVKFEKEQRGTSAILKSQMSLIQQMKELCKANIQKKQRLASQSLPSSVNVPTPPSILRQTKPWSAPNGYIGTSKEMAPTKPKKRGIFKGFNIFKGKKNNKKEEQTKNFNETDTECSESPARSTNSGNVRDSPNPQDNHAECSPKNNLNSQQVTKNASQVTQSASDTKREHARSGSIRVRQPSDLSESSVVTQKARGDKVPEEAEYHGDGNGQSSTPYSMFTLQVNLDGGKTFAVTDAGELVMQLDAKQKMKAKAHLLALQAQISELSHMIDTM